MKKKFKDTKVGQFLTRVAPGVIDLVGDTFPPVKLLTNLFDQQNVRDEDKLEFERLVREYEVRELEAYLRDIQDARDLQKTALKQEDKFSKRFLYWFTLVSTGLGFLYIFAITFVKIPEHSQRFADTILGVVIALVFGSIYNFWFGSSKASQEKSKDIVNLKSR